MTIAPPRDTAQPPTHAPPSPSLLSKHLTPVVRQALKDLQTCSGVTLNDCIRSGLAHSDSAIGVYAGDEESYECFGLLFAPLIQDWHGDLGAAAAYDPSPAAARPVFPNLDPEGRYIRSTRIRLARNLRGYRLMPTISRAELVEVERLIVAALSRLTQDLAGSYHAAPGWRGDAAPGPAPAHARFDASDRFQQAAGICRHWPQGRGVFCNPAQTLHVRVNEEDHLRMVSMQDGADIEAVYARLLRACAPVEQALPFQHSPRYGYLAACPSNLGTGLRASFHIRLPLSGGSPEFKQLCASHGMTVRSASGEGGVQQGTVYDISNHRRLGVSPVQCIQELLAGTEKIVELERCFL